MQHKKILMVDDEPIMLEEMSEFLESLDFDCVVASSVDEALQAIQDDSDITLVITDMRMPGKDGKVLLRALGELSPREFECLVISGHLDADSELSGTAKFPLTVMRKPVDIDEVVTFLNAREFIG